MPEISSFIPKTEAVKQIYSSKGLGWLMGLSSVFFILSLMLSFGLFFYRGFLETGIAKLSDDLKKVESEFEPSLILELQATAKSLDSVKISMNKHVALSQLFDFLKANTIFDASFSNFSYDKKSVQMSGTAKSYAALAQQSLVFEKSRLIKDVLFSNFSLTSEGFVNFSVKFTPEAELISYKPVSD
ncbi:MAG: hypothetical protein A2931_04435 [Candidatus Niyogibacteria bacterium RIFCSPLOWO2_01_FULL_45_48]|uniref:PilN domain-containing protein n=2 Tax=Candidatus Niyogiibacteriota TaxID=1817912 RepID=A0A1G2EXJ4_9BACT|nr:MAG: hypothetical protein A2835_02755 [Candidatus Niyogibacteria bacterium RIFCSPHIGHO2_01_FULL_45_28]OGZ29613.1 MAG: hypothetical protein A2931_04435 [Candidatus Niyogibacteria bacterium RIFCSPLOWO2_01_FULL_45_48]OGZ30232.1 MAG: hypothetical protein A3J00_01040 [Candidatus Niyogibacteria bacterium RIFCSPLOWO2_02_FULL_45_13]